MSEKELRELVDEVARFVEHCFTKHGEAPALLFGIAKTGPDIMLPVPMHDKDLAAGLMRAALTLVDAERCVFTCEGWVVEEYPKDAAETEAMKKRWADEGISEHPNRVEVVLFHCEDADAGVFEAHRPIIRKDRRKPTLGPLKYTVTPDDGGGAEGRMVGLLPQPERGKMQ